MNKCYNTTVGKIHTKATSNKTTKARTHIDSYHIWLTSEKFGGIRSRPQISPKLLFAHERKLCHELLFLQKPCDEKNRER